MLKTGTVDVTNVNCSKMTIKSFLTKDLDMSSRKLNFHKMIHVSAAVVAASGLLMSCSNSSGDSVQPKRFETVIEMRDAYIEAGGDCPNWELSTVSLAIGSGSCSDSSVLSIYSSREIANEQNSQMKAYILEMFPSSLNDRLTLLVGENWILNDSDSTAFNEFKSLYGGDVISSYNQIP